MSDTSTTQKQDKVLLTIDERILAIEAELPYKSMPGTTLSRCFKETQGVEWVLALGPIQMPKTFFRGPTIEDVVSQGEKAVAEMKARGAQRLETDWDRLDETISVGLSGALAVRASAKGKGREWGDFADAAAGAARPAKVSRKKKGA